MPAVFCTALVRVVVALLGWFGRSTSVAHAGVEMENRGGCTGVGFWGFGSILGVTISWSVHHSILWMMLHGMLSWLYVIYYSIKR
jgi:hypothetical protein